MFITAFTSARHLSLSWASSIQSILPHPTFWRFILILSSHLPLDLPSKADYCSPFLCKINKHLRYMCDPLMLSWPVHWKLYIQRYFSCLHFISTWLVSFYPQGFLNIQLHKIESVVVISNTPRARKQSNRHDNSPHPSPKIEDAWAYTARTAPCSCVLCKAQSVQAYWDWEPGNQSGNTFRGNNKL
jgi:hypothetical protein